MAKELIVSVNGREKKIAIIEDDQVTEFYIERGEDNQGIVGNIYKGRVMRVLPGMQSAFVNVGLERDAFLYVSDFFDEEEEFERIVIDKAKKGEADAGRAAAEQIALGRVEREHHIEATHERAEPLREAEVEAVLGEVAPVATGQPAETADTGRRRSRRGRRRGRGRDGQEAPVEQAAASAADVEEEEIITPFVETDPSIQRIVDEEENAAVNGEMFKDARLQERIFDQIHAVEFNFEDDYRNAEVGSFLPSGGFQNPSFQRIDDGEDTSDQGRIMMRAPETIAAHVKSFVDSVDGQTLPGGTFQRISDDEEPEQLRTPSAFEGEADEETEAPGFAARAVERIVSVARRKTGSRKPAVSKSTKTRASSKKAPTKKRAKSVTDNAVDSESPSKPTADTGVEDSETRITGNRSRGEFATRRGGRRRRRPTSKPKTTGGADQDAPTNEQDEETETSTDITPVEEAKPAAPLAKPAAAEPTSRDREQSSRDYPRSQRRDRQQPTITDLLDEGQEILVQIAKEPIAKKGARITSHIALPGRFLVYMPTVEHVGVSRKIESDSERHRLRKLIQMLRAEEDIPSGGFIVRTAGVGISEPDLREDVRYLVRTWLDIRAAAEKSKPASLVHRDLDLVQRILRDQLSNDFSAIRVDSEEEYARIVEFVNRIQPRMVKRVKLYTKEQPILEAYGVQAEIDKAIKPRVWLRSGGYLVINQTEALVAIDVNTGKFVGRGSGRLEDTITRTNLEAVDEIVRQIRLRDLGGIIVLDLIDMEERRNRTRVMQALQDALRHDKSPTKVLSFNDFGLVIMTRKRVKQSLERTLCAPCQYCQGAGLIKSPQTVCYELLEEARRVGKAMNGDKANKQATLRINPEVARALRGPERDVLNEIEEYLGPVDINSDPRVHQEQFDFA
ncbi:MAG TPA: Rne/Rng family ribonuclease, partial [Pyrinomonadaceae bacterium]|nr:Rne/Rng family ribonuclease [Pyrinomonadaceae bacterium]